MPSSSALLEHLQCPFELLFMELRFSQRCCLVASTDAQHQQQGIAAISKQSLRLTYCTDTGIHHSSICGGPAGRNDTVATATAAATSWWRWHCNRHPAVADGASTATDTRPPASYSKIIRATWQTLLAPMPRWLRHLYRFRRYKDSLQPNQRVGSSGQLYHSFTG
jgi:hypothetical protein